jgi:hypothetical protein
MVAAEIWLVSLSLFTGISILIILAFVLKTWFSLSTATKIGRFLKNKHFINYAHN